MSKIFDHPSEHIGFITTKDVHSVGYSQPKWECQLWAGTSYRPYNNQVPNWFYRKMQEWLLGVKWIKLK